jgi:rubredoxin
MTVTARTIFPGDEETIVGDPVSFVVRWNKLVDAWIVESSVKLLARTAVDYGVHDGQEIYPGNEQLSRKTGLSTVTIGKAWKILQASKMAELDVASMWTGKWRTANVYSLMIPGDWENLPIYGPNCKRFTCQHCGHLFNPQPGTDVGKNGGVGYYIARMVFCPDPGRPKRQHGEAGPRKPFPPGCAALWQKGAGKDTKITWEMFRKARDDEWVRPAVASADRKARAEAKAERERVINGEGMSARLPEAARFNGTGGRADMHGGARSPVMSAEEMADLPPGELARRIV